MFYKKILNRFENDHHMVAILKGTSISLPLKITGTLLTFFFNLCLARLIGATGAGLFFLALTVATIASVFGRMGLDNAMLKYAAVGASEGDWTSVNGIYRQGMVTAMAASTVAFVIIILGAPIIAETIFSKPDLVNPLRWMAFSIMPMSLYLLHAVMLRSIMKITSGVFILASSVPLFSLLLAFPLCSLYNVQGAVIAHAISCNITLAIGFYLWRKYTFQSRNVQPSFDYKLLMVTSMPLFLVQSNHLIMNWMSTFFLEFLQAQKT